MSDLSVNEADPVVLIKELLNRTTPEIALPNGETSGSKPLFREHSITNTAGKVQLLGIMANVELTVTPSEEEE
tara:strand:+ start:32 stop:250 length:219 start_codon:yes stop_codon:yes gene_type:complete